MFSAWWTHKNRFQPEVDGPRWMLLGVEEHLELFFKYFSFGKNQNMFCQSLSLNLKTHGFQRKFNLNVSTSFTPPLQNVLLKKSELMS